MIIGRGLIAKLFLDIDQDDVVFFASGVSNSLETNPKEFLREKELIEKTIQENPTKLFIYFSSCSIYDSSKNKSAYVNHKLNMEHLIQLSTNKYLILRISNAVGKGGNNNTLMNFLVDAIQNNKKITIHSKATRNLIDVKDIRDITLQLIKEKKTNQIINLAYPENFYITEIVEVLESLLNKRANSVKVIEGIDYNIDTKEINSYFTVYHKINYLKLLTQKYFL